jgi:2-hydroxy-6-oxonona-2,4-dienedioate hydrolase
MRSARLRYGIVVGLALAALVGAAATLAAFRRDISTADARVSGRSNVVEGPYGLIEYAALGQGPTVLAIHGSGGGFDQGLEMMGPLVGRGYRLIAPSRFGYLRSSRPKNASPEVQADALAWLIARLGEKKVIVVGGSAGALPAMQFAIRHPEMTRAVVLIVPASYSPERRTNENAMGGPIGERVVLTVLRSDLLFWAAIRLFPDQMTRAVLATDPALVRAAPTKEQARVRAILFHILPVSRRTEGLIDDSRWAGAPPPYPLYRITAPLLAVSLEDDLYGTYASAKYTAASVRNGAMIGYPSGGHVWVGRDAQLWHDVAAFLGALPPN